MASKNYRDLIAWQKAMELVELVYSETKKFPREEVYALTSQLRRAAVSVPSNIAEGQGRTSSREFLNFLSMAYGSLREIETQIIIAERLGYMSEGKARSILELSGEVGRLINGLSSSLKRRTDT
ncbi:MAG: four helix bundle protein [Phycisphaerae bacterium]|nr:four helix bundle protein [Phycisphaerae bacterium]